MMRTANRNINKNTRSCYLVALVVIASLALASGARHLTASASASSYSNGDQTYSSSFTTGGGLASASASSDDNFAGSFSQDGEGFSVASDGAVTVTSDGTQTATVTAPKPVTSDDTSAGTGEDADAVVTVGDTQTVTAEDQSSVVGEGTATATASATGTGSTTQIVTAKADTNPFILTGPLDAFINTPKGAEKETTIDENVVKAVSAGGFAVAETKKLPKCEDRGDYRHCCNTFHQYSDFCKCKFIPLHGRIFERLWECDAVRLSDTSGTTIWLDLWTGDECYCA
jgi:uncharacterized protein YidB (DUF937 family)